MKIEFSTAEYRSNHGAQPRGRGSWAFVFSGGGAKTDYTSDEIWWAPAPLTFGEAVKTAKVEARRRFAGSGEHRVTVGVCS